MSITSLLLSAISVLICIGIHEWGHAVVAYLLGDNTAKNEGRLTLNPFSHVDITGFLALMFFGFGWAKPVPVRPTNFKNYKVGMAITSLAGPMSNIILSTVLYTIVTILMQFNSQFIYAIINFLMMVASMSVGLAVFNLLPIPPLDGSKIFFQFFPKKWRMGMVRYEQYIQFGLLLGLLSGFLSIPLSILQKFVIRGILNVVDMITFFI